MSMRGSCRCNNIQLSWRNVDYSLVPRACGCQYCGPRGAAYVSKSGTQVTVTARKPKLVRQQRHGSQQATFYECAYCNDIVLAASTIDGETYGAINVQCLDRQSRFPPPVQADVCGQSPEEKLRRWRSNWCSPATVKI